ncbi:hypothetical protein [Vampirovibrio chlorellavorus]|uniref:hypothetical protein n=1 Tax=Vampirovibrio chlorellavorus TaxID=758823 RepID=UPI0026EB31C9|nr:hypothetical protein [Vampirovibrio chlorellavorus]
MARHFAVFNIPASASAIRHGQPPEPAYRFYVPQDKAKRKSRAQLHQLEFLSAVFAQEGANRFFKTFLLRFLFDSGKTAADESATRGLPVAC